MHPTLVKKFCSTQKVVELWLQHCALTALYQMVKNEIEPLYLEAFSGYDFFTADDPPKKITDPELLYLSEQDELLDCFYQDCEDIVRLRGYWVKKDVCPIALVKNHLSNVERRILISIGEISACDFLTVKLEYQREAITLFLRLVSPLVPQKDAHQNSMRLAMKYLFELKTRGTIISC